MLSEGVRCSGPALPTAQIGTPFQAIWTDPTVRPLRSSSVVVNVGASIDASAEIVRSVVALLFALARNWT